MPLLLKRETIRLFEASVEMLSLAILGLGMPRRIEIRESGSNYAAQIGLIGASAELAMSAVIVQTMGTSALILGNGHFKSGAEILEDFRRIIQNPVPRSSFITQGIDNPLSHLTRIAELTSNFRILITARAGGLHAGKGPSREVCAITANDVIRFLSTLALSSRIKPYLSSVPLPIEMVRDRAVILEDIIRSIQSTENTHERARLLSSLYLVLPNIPDEEPDWLQALGRINIAPQDNDIIFLLNLLEQAHVTDLIRVGRGGTGLPVVVRRDDPRALPIAPQYLRRALADMREQWYADLGTANGRLENGMFDIPPSDYIMDLFAVGLEESGIILEHGNITGHEAWPFIVSSLSVSGTAGPYWFLVRKTNDLGQLKAQIERAISIGPAYLKNRENEIINGLESIRRNRPLTTEVEFVNELVRAEENAEAKKERLAEAVQRAIGTERELSNDYSRLVLGAANGENSIGQVLLNLVEHGIGLDSTRAKGYWARMLCEAAKDEEDIPGLLAVLRTAELNQAHTGARKAIRLIDFLSHGPVVALRDNDIA